MNVSICIGLQPENGLIFGLEEEIPQWSKTHSLLPTSHVQFSLLYQGEYQTRLLITDMDHKKSGHRGTTAKGGSILTTSVFKYTNTSNNALVQHCSSFRTSPACWV